MLVLFFLSLETAIILSISPWSWSSFSIARGRCPSALAQALPQGCRDGGQPQGLLHPVLWCEAHSPWLRLFGPLTFFSRVCLQVLRTCLVSATCFKCAGAECGGCSARVSGRLQRDCRCVTVPSLTQEIGSFIPVCVIAWSSIRVCGHSWIAGICGREEGG